jgi:hypothetical protein
MYCTTNPYQIAKELETARRVIAKYDGKTGLCMAHADALSSAKATIALYAEVA